MTDDLPQDPTGLRYYGGDMTIHGTNYVNVEIDRHGVVVAVWFRCQHLPFTATRVEDARAAHMHRMYEEQAPAIDAVVIREVPRR